ncbi:uncharacterized protein LOC129600178 [Paramacrobiotus metropolitanus]|uniref:uncharacterized protein LOC129600178 n=1 Tax=Paramacrobiotus metropolitanus TaxID=2943436 RepID=UPI002445F200|nr:uncharacterized protein LOC129600178 [Paramacrobiotus metropolitanus]
MTEQELTDPRLRQIASCFTIHDDFPIKGVRFRNILPLFRNPEIFQLLVDVCVERIKEKFGGPIDLIVGLESRGFLFGPSVALKLRCGFAPIRKPGKLPGNVARVEFAKEYGKDVFEMEAGAIKPGQGVVVVDDVLATGGSMAAASELVRHEGGKLLGCFIVVDLSYLHGRQKLPPSIPCEALFSYSS